MNCCDHLRKLITPAGRPRPEISAFLLAVLLLSGCSAFNETRLEGTLGRDVDMIGYAYDIADDLIDHAFPPLIPRLPNQAILTTTFVDNNDLSRTSHFGRLLQEHIGSRLVQQGYTVREIKLRRDLLIEPRSGETILTRELDLIESSQPAQALLVGTISRAQRTMYITARLVSPYDGTIISAKNYRLYMDRNVLAMYDLIPDDGGTAGEIQPPEEPMLNRILY